MRVVSESGALMAVAIKSQPFHAVCLQHDAGEVCKAGGLALICGLVRVGFGMIRVRLLQRVAGCARGSILLL
jgi:hypothetical protein